nr:hypothetical protein [Alphaproteobacteria bacterium]
MRRKLFPVIVLALCLQTHAAFAADMNPGGVPRAAVVGRGELSIAFWDVYEAVLYAPDGRWDPEKPFALSIHYYREIEGPDIADRSVREIRRQGFDNEIQLAAWNAQLKEIFPDVRNGSVLTASYQPGIGTRFYADKNFIGEI